MFRFETLEIWTISVDYADEIYDVIERFPQSVQYNLGSQLRSSALSISNNIAEGSGSNSSLEFKSFLNYSIRSVFETVSCLIFAKRRKLLDEEKFDKLYKDAELLAKKIHSFRKSL